MISASPPTSTPTPPSPEIVKEVIVDCDDSLGKDYFGQCPGDRN